MVVAQRIQEFRKGFTSLFWIANTLELFERLAFYGMKAILTVFLAERVGLVEEAGTLAGLFSGVVYSLPIVAGVLVDRYGFKKTLMSCFAIFTIGYFLIGLAGMEYGDEITNAIGKKTYTMLVLLLTAFGGSLIKPCIVGTVSMTSRPESKSLGFSVYYTLVNLGGALGPIIALPVRETWGIEYVLIMSSITSFLLLIGTIIFFREPEGEISERRTFAKLFADMVLVFGNLRFITFVVLFGGFWLMFWQIFYLLPFYVDKVLHFKEFELIESVDAACIIIFTIPITALVKNWKPFVAMTTGLIISTCCWVIIGTFHTLTATIIGISVYAFGEAIQTPRFYEYVSNLAPKNQIGTFMGFAFLPVAIGSFGAGPVADWLRNNYLNTDPTMMWYIVSMIGVATTLLMFLYNAVVTRSIPSTNS